MKYLLALFSCAFLAGCETVENADGTTSTRFDAKAAASLMDSGFDAYDQYQRRQQPEYYSPQPAAVYPWPTY